MAEKIENEKQEKKGKASRKILIVAGLVVGVLVLGFVVMVIASMVSNGNKIKTGNDFLSKGEYDLAIEQYDSTGSGNAEALRQLGLANAAKGEYEKALWDFTESLKHVSNDTQTLTYRAELYETLGDYAHAIADYENIVKRNSNVNAKRKIEELRGK
jgi:tetratricopeptide (TPR) repeat protein